MAVAATGPRVGVDGKFFRFGERKFYVKGVTYGPFSPDAFAQPFPTLEQAAADFEQIQELGANTLRIYHVPSRPFLDLAATHRLKVLVDVPWNSHLCFLDSRQQRQEALDAIRRAVYACGRHPAVLAFSVANEIPADIVRWSGAGRIAQFIDLLILEAKKIDPGCLCTFANFPTTEFLRPLCPDFLSFNLYLHNRNAFRNYLARLQMHSDGKPLLLSEFGLDSLREGEERKAEMLQWQIADAFRAGLAGTVLFSYTDEWWRGGQAITDWEFGVVSRDRRRKPSFTAVRDAFTSSPSLDAPRQPKVSVVVASYNADRTLKACLESLLKLNYPDYEVILVDDGSTDTTRQIAFLHTGVKYIRHEKNLGLSAARNTGIAAATGEIIAFTDADCRADENWLQYLVADLLENEFAGMGGPNLLPPEDSAVAAAVMVSPGGPAHVMLTDRQAEHIPGCNMAFFKSVLVDLGGFDPVFRKAGDDVDLCWRLQQAGHKIGFSPSAFVWHYRRSTVSEYFKQQRGYGHAEAMLVRKHPEYFNALGGGAWRGRIYAAAKYGVLLRPPVIYHGPFGGAGFQFLYGARPAGTLMLLTTIEYHFVVTLPLWILTVMFHPLLAAALASTLLPAGICLAAGLQAELPRDKAHWWSRGLVAWLYFCQPIVRGWARYHGRLAPRPAPLAAQQTLDSVALRNSDLPLEQLDYWAETRIDRLQFVAAMPRELARQGWAVKSDEGWSDYDLEVYGSRWASLRITTIAEDHPVNRQLFRCRLRPVWSLQAKAGFWGLLAIELLALGISDASWRWLLLLPVSVAAALWLLRREKRTLQSTIAAFLDGFAKQWNLFKISAQPAASPAMKSAEALLSSKPSPFAESASRPQASQPAEAEKKIVQV